jgi:hypothetical protein
VVDWQEYLRTTAIFLSVIFDTVLKMCLKTFHVAKLGKAVYLKPNKNVNQILSC